MVPLLVVVLLLTASWMTLICTRPEISLYYKTTGPMSALIARCPVLKRGFRASPWLSSGHLMTLSVLFRKGPPIIFSRELIDTEDGGRLSLDWVSRTSQGAHERSSKALDIQPILILFHGLTGGSHESYVRDMAELAFTECRMRVVVANCRSCAHSSLLTPTAYCAAWTQDIRLV